MVILNNQSKQRGSELKKKVISWCGGRCNVQFMTENERFEIQETIL